MAEWFLRLGDSSLGPYSSKQFAEMAVDGRLAPTDPIRRGDMTAWVLAAKLQGLTFPPELPPLPTASSPSLMPPQVPVASGQTAAPSVSLGALRKRPSYAVLGVLLVASVATATWGTQRAGPPTAGPPTNNAQGRSYAASTPRLTREQLAEKINGKYADAAADAATILQILNSSWRREPTPSYSGETGTGVFDLVYLDAAGKPTATPTAAFGMLMMHPKLGPSPFLVPIQPQLGPDGAVVRLDLLQIPEGPPQRLLGPASSLSLMRRGDAEESRAAYYAREFSKKMEADAKAKDSK
jgi:hypothetical protein